MPLKVPDIHSNKGIQIKITCDFIFSHIWTAKIKKTTDNKCWWWCGQEEERRSSRKDYNRAQVPARKKMEKNEGSINWEGGSGKKEEK